MTRTTILHITDVHTLNDAVPTRRIAHEFLTVVEEAGVRLGGLQNLDYLKLTGDFFDTIGLMTREDGAAAVGLISAILNLCAVNDIKLRVLEGTPSHDNKQNKHFVELNEVRQKPCDLRYIEDIELYTEEDGLRVIAVPDKARGTCDKIKAEVAKLLSNEPSGKVDLMLTHGTYLHHHLPGVLDVHDGQWYSSKVEYLVLNGHIHTPSFRDRILTGGSLTRLNHGEEEAKGAHLITLDRTARTFEVEFIENKGATLFNTYSYPQASIEEIQEDVVRQLETAPRLAEGHIRILHPKGLPIKELVKVLGKTYPNCKLKAETLKESGEIEADRSLVDKDDAFSAINLKPMTKESLPGMLADKLKGQGIEEPHAKAALQLLSGVL